jgi:hypothetical protein
MSEKRQGAVEFVFGVRARWPGGAAKLLEFTPAESFQIDEEMLDENGRVIEEYMDDILTEGTAVLGIPKSGFTAPALGSVITMTLSQGVTKKFVVKRKEPRQEARSYERLTVNISHKEYVNYGGSSS